MFTHSLRSLRHRLGLPTVASRRRHENRRPVLLVLETLEDRLAPAGVLTLNSSLPADTVNVAYNQSISASGGTGDLKLAVSNISNAIPGLSITGNGTGSISISGTPTAVGTETFTVTGADGAGDTTDPVSYSITVNPAITPSSTTQTLMVTSYFDGAVYEINADTGALIKTLVAPSSQSILSSPAGVTEGPDGNLYITGETGEDNIDVYNFSTQTLSTFITGAQLAAANGGAPFAPGGIAFGPDGNLYVDNTLSGTGVDEVLRLGITNNAYNGTSTTIATGLTLACDMTFGVNPGDQDNLYVSDDNSVVKITDATGAAPTISTFVSAGSGGLVYSCGLTWVDGNLYDTDPGGGQVLEYSANGAFLGVFTSSALQGQSPCNTLLLPDGDWVTANSGPSASGGMLQGSANAETGSLMEFNSNGTYLQTLSASAFPANAAGVTNFAPAFMTLYTPVVQSTVTSVAPNTGPTTGGNLVTINGTFAGSGDTVLFGATAATVTNDTTTSITVIAPAGVAGTVNVTVDGSAANAADKYTYVAPPSPPGSSSSAPTSVNAPPLLGLINLFFHGAETVNANGTVTYTYSLYGFTFLTATYNSEGSFVSGALFGITLPNFIWSL